MVERKFKLQEILVESPRVLLSRHVETHGKRYFEEVVMLGLEGAMAKRRAIPHVTPEILSTK